jgi:hypothetical protein
MDLTLRQLVFLEHEMEQIMDDPDRDSEDRSHASSILGRIEGEIEWEEEQHEQQNGSDKPTELFS